MLPVDELQGFVSCAGSPGRQVVYGLHRQLVSALFKGLASMLASRSLRLRVACGLKENVAALPPITNVKRVSVKGAGVVIENKEGKKASVAIYQHLAKQFGGKLTPAAAAEGLRLYAEVVEDAKQRPGAHPNIDLLFGVVDGDKQYDIVVEMDA